LSKKIKKINKEKI